MAPQWLDTRAYPFTSHYFPVNGHKLHYIDEGRGEVLLFVHGTPSWSFDFREVIKELSGTFRCIAIDHMGFGLSDKPEHYDYSTINHSKTLERFILEKQLHDLTLVVHDFGGPIGLSFAIDHPASVKKLVILNSWLWSTRNDLGYIKLRKILKSPLLPFLYRWLNISPRFLLPASFGEHKLSSHTRKQYSRPFANRTQRNGPLAFARSLLDDQDRFEALWRRKNAISSKPALFIWGLKDRVIGPAYLHRFITGFTDPTTVMLEKSGHFPQEEEPGKVAEAIRQFLAK